MSSLKNILINMVTLGILIFAIMSTIIIIQHDSNLNEQNKIINNNNISDSFDNLESSLDKESNAQSSLGSLEEVPPQDYIGDLSVASMVSSTRTGKDVISGLWSVYVKLPMSILGVDSLIASAISTILLILIAIGIWAIWKGAIS